jgi:hypothetical protein
MQTESSFCTFLCCARKIPFAFLISQVVQNFHERTRAADTKRQMPISDFVLSSFFYGKQATVP